MGNTNVRVSAIQSRVRRYDREYNVARNLEMVEAEAQQHSPDVICIPNYFFQTGLEAIPGPTTKRFADIAVKHGAFIIGGMAEGTACGDGYNSGFLIYPDGGVYPFQKKLHMISMEKKKLKAGCKLLYIDTPLGRWGCVMCNDVFFPEVARCLALKGVEIIFIPSIIGGKGVNGLQAVARTRAIENQVYVVNANGIPYEVADKNPDEKMGQSGIYSPFLDNIDLARAGNEETAIRATLDLAALRKIKQSKGLDADSLDELAKGKSFNMLADRRPELYCEITKKMMGYCEEEEG